MPPCVFAKQAAGCLVCLSAETMADAALFIGWGQVVRGREKRAVQVFNESVEYWGGLQGDGKIEDFEVVLLAPHGGDRGGVRAVARQPGPDERAARRRGVRAPYPAGQPDRRIPGCRRCPGRRGGGPRHGPVPGGGRPTWTSSLVVGLDIDARATSGTAFQVSDDQFTGYPPGKSRGGGSAPPLPLPPRTRSLRDEQNHPHWDPGQCHSRSWPTRRNSRLCY